MRLLESGAFHGDGGGGGDEVVSVCQVVLVVLGGCYCCLVHVLMWAEFRWKDWPCTRYIYMRTGGTEEAWEHDSATTW